MSSAVHTFVQPITEPLNGLHGHFSQLATKHRDANDQLHSYANDLLSANGFIGTGAIAFSGLVNYYVNTSEKHMQALDNAANAVYTCHSSIMDATYTASSANLHDGLTHKVLKHVNHNQIIQDGGDSIQAVISDMMSTLNDMKNAAGGFFGNLFTGHFGDAFGDLGQEFSDVGQLVGDITSLLQDIGRVLGQWASAIRDAVGNCLKVIGSVLWNVVDFIFDFSGIVNDVKTLFDPHKSLWDKILAAGDLILNVGMDVLMVTGIGEELRAGELLAKGAFNIAKRLMEDGGKEFIEKELPKLAETRARAIGDAIVAKLGPKSRSFLTVGTAIVQDGDKIRTLIATNEKASSNLVKLVMSELGPGEELVSLAEKQGRHAEQVLAQYIEDNQLKLLGLGASNNFCNKICGPMLIEKFGQKLLGQIWPRP